jgi:hypothetical protein
MDRFSLTFNDGLQPQAARGPVCRSPVGTRRGACEFADLFEHGLTEDTGKVGEAAIQVWEASLLQREFAAQPPECNAQGRIYQNSQRDQDGPPGGECCNAKYPTDAEIKQRSLYVLDDVSGVEWKDLLGTRLDSVFIKRGFTGMITNIV